MEDGQRSKVAAALASALFTAMVDDVVSTAAFDAHISMSRARQPCSICHTHCQSAHAPGPSNTSVTKALDSVVPLTTEPTAPNNRKLAIATAAPTKTEILLNCLNCERPIASSRYASHLSTCMGIGNSRRGAVRNSASKAAQDAEARSPYIDLDSGDDVPIGKGKAKALNGDLKPGAKSKKRALEPKAKSVSPKKAKLAAAAGTGPPPRPPENFVPLPAKGTGPPRRPAYVPLHPPTNGYYAPQYPHQLPLRPPNQSNVPSGLRASSVASASSVSQDSIDGRSQTPAFSTKSSTPAQSQLHPPHVDLYHAKPLIYPSGNWVKTTGMSGVQPSHIDADEVVDSDSSDSESS